MPDTEALRARPTWIAVFMVVAFVAGNLVTMSMGWGTRSSQIDALTSEVARLSGAVSILAEKYTVSDKTTSNTLQQQQDHLVYNDIRLDKYELRIEKLEQAKK